MKPWEKFQQEQPSAKPWEKFAPQVTSQPSLIDVATGPATVGDWARGRVEEAKEVVSPEFWKGVAGDVTKPLPPITTENIAKLTNPSQAAVEGMSGAVLGTMPVTALPSAARSFLFKPAAKATGAATKMALEGAGKAGYSVPRSNIKQNFLTNLGERFGGKQAIEAAAQAKNQPVTNKLAAKALGLSDDIPITVDVLKAIREEAGKAYEAVRNVGVLSADDTYRAGLKKIKTEFSGASKDFPELASKEVAKLSDALNKKVISSEGAIEMIKNLRDAARSSFGPTASAKDKLLGKAQRKAADALEDLIERNIEPKLGKNMLDAYRKARQTIAKTYTVEGALVGENVSAQKLARIAKKTPVSGELKQIAQFAESFPRLSRVEMGAPASGGLFEPLVYGMSGAAATGGPGAAAAAIPIIGKPIARHLMTTIPKTSVARTPSSLESFLAQRGFLGSASAASEIQSMKELEKLLSGKR